MSKITLFFLGPPRIEEEGAVVSPDTRKATALLARLALSGERLSRDLLAAFLWPESDERRAKAALRRTLSDLKSTVGEEALLISRDALGVNLDNAWCDVLAFQEALSAVKEHGHQRGLCDGCMPQAESAVTLYRDDFMAGFYLRDSRPFDDWQLQQTEYLRREFAALLEALVQAKEASGELEEALPYAQQWLGLDPLREEAHRQLIKLYAWTGRRTAALKQYRDCVRILEEELGVPPLEETTALYQAVQENRLDPPQITAPPAPPPQTAAEDEERQPAFIPFLGRDTELAEMAAIYDRVGPNGRLLVVSGEAGIGKTTLAETFLSDRPDTVQLLARCYPGETHLTYAPFVMAMRDGLRREDAAARVRNVAPAYLAEAARLLPELEAMFPNLPGAPPLDWPGAQGRFFEGLSQVLDALLNGSEPGILWLDDTHWADSASLEFLAFLARRLQGRPSLLLVCWRSGDLTEGSRLPQLLAEMRRQESGILITLDRLPQETVARLVAAVFDSPQLASAEPISSRLYSETEGLPFLITAYLQSLPEDASSDEGGWDMPATVRDLFQSRLATVGETERQILQTAAVIGRACRFELLKTVSGRSDEETIAGIEEALGHLLLAEHPPHLDYDFSHHKLRDLVLDEMSLARRRLLNRRVARALAIQHGLSEAAPSEYAARIAGHYQAAGLDDKAAGYYFQAGNYARSLFARGEALAHFQTALALGYPNLAELHEICGGLHMRLGEYSAALNSLERAAAQGDGQRQRQLEHKIGQVYFRRGEWESAEYHFQQAVAAANGGATADNLARLYGDWSYTAYRAGDIERALLLAQKAQALSANAPSRAQVDNILGMLERHNGRLQSAADHFALSYKLAREHRLLGLEITAANNLGLAKMDAGDHAAALALFEGALAQCQRYGDRHWQAAIHNNMADLYHAMGQEEKAMAHLKESITILAEIGREAGDWQPEIWKLSEW